MFDFQFDFAHAEGGRVIIQKYIKHPICKHVWICASIQTVPIDAFQYKSSNLNMIL